MPSARSIISGLREGRKLNEEGPEEIDPSAEEPSAPPEAATPAPTPEPEPEVEPAEIPAEDFSPEDVQSADYILNGDPITYYYQRVRDNFGRRARGHSVKYNVDFKRLSRTDIIPGVAEYYKAPGESLGWTSGETNALTSTTWLVYENGNIALRYVDTNMLVITPESEVTTFVNGWTTMNSLSRMNQFLPNSGWKIARHALGRGQDAGADWFWYNRSTGVGGHGSGILIEFSDGDKILPTGKLVPRLQPRYGLRYKKQFPPSLR